ncbi:hypothetical protein SAMN05421684_6555 [Asanoa ishikariensis]|uniref:Uncharacterized protein n=1 Tax=Asanoa ishikariensis TaxID=137265 RepID=A0A1H3TYS6_9ACTN|nr:hypothetical protein SAMN05421684_6555 [Asanoa ishikariensis]
MKTITWCARRWTISRRAAARCLRCRLSSPRSRRLRQVYAHRVRRFRRQAVGGRPVRPSRRPPPAGPRAHRPPPDPPVRLDQPAQRFRRLAATGPQVRTTPPFRRPQAVSPQLSRSPLAGRRRTRRGLPRRRHGRGTRSRLGCSARRGTVPPPRRPGPRSTHQPRLCLRRVLGDRTKWTAAGRSLDMSQRRRRAVRHRGEQPLTTLRGRARTAAMADRRHRAVRSAGVRRRRAHPLRPAPARTAVRPQARRTTVADGRASPPTHRRNRATPRPHRRHRATPAGGQPRNPATPHPHNQATPADGLPRKPATPRPRNRATLPDGLPRNRATSCPRNQATRLGGPGLPAARRRTDSRPRLGCGGRSWSPRGRGCRRRSGRGPGLLPLHPRRSRWRPYPCMVRWRLPRLGTGRGVAVRRWPRSSPPRRRSWPRCSC